VYVNVIVHVLTQKEAGRILMVQKKS